MHTAYSFSFSLALAIILTLSLSPAVHARVWVCVSRHRLRALPHRIALACVWLCLIFMSYHRLYGWHSMCGWYARVRCLYVFFQFVTSVCYSLFFSFSFFFISFNIIYEFYLIFRKRIMRPLNFFFVSSTLFHSSAYNSWLHRSNVFETRMVFFLLIHYTFVCAFLGRFVLPNWNGGRLRAYNKSKLDVSRGCASSFPTKRVKYWQDRNHCSVNTRRIEYYLRAWPLSFFL